MSMVSGDKLNEIYQNGVRPNSNTYVVCSTAGNTATKTVTSTGFALTSGKHITVKFTNENTAKNLKLKVNTLDAKSLLYRGEDIGEQPIAANSILEFVYNGTAFECIGGMGDSGKILSWAAYQALTPAEQAKGDYYIYDKGSVGGVVDSTLDTSSGNAIANSAVATAINGINSDLTELGFPKKIWHDSWTLATTTRVDTILATMEARYKNNCPITGLASVDISLPGIGLFHGQITQNGLYVTLVGVNSSQGVLYSATSANGVASMLRYIHNANSTTNIGDISGVTCTGGNEVQLLAIEM